MSLNLSQIKLNRTRPALNKTSGDQFDTVSLRLGRITNNPHLALSSRLHLSHEPSTSGGCRTLHTRPVRAHQASASPASARTKHRQGCKGLLFLLSPYLELLSVQSWREWKEWTGLFLMRAESLVEEVESVPL